MKQLKEDLKQLPKYWLRSPNPLLGNRTPLQAIKNGEIERVQDVAMINVLHMKGKQI